MHGAENLTWPMLMAGLSWGQKVMDVLSQSRHTTRQPRAVSSSSSGHPARKEDMEVSLGIRQ